MNAPDRVIRLACCCLAPVRTQGERCEACQVVDHATRMPREGGSTRSLATVEDPLAAFRGCLYTPSRSARFSGRSC